MEKVFIDFGLEVKSDREQIKLPFLGFLNVCFDKSKTLAKKKRNFLNVLAQMFEQKVENFIKFHLNICRKRFQASFFFLSSI